jgi:DedD protein
MPSREPELYKDKIEVSLDGRQIFYLFFGGAVIVGLVFVLGVFVGRRVEARGHLDRAETQAESDPLAALDRLERSDRLSFQGALRGGEATTDVEKAIGELDKRRAEPRPDKKSADAKLADVKSADAKSADAKLADAKSADAKLADAKLADPKSVSAKSDAKSADAKSVGAKSADAKLADAKSADAKSADAKSEAKSDGKSDGKSDAKSADAKSEVKSDGKSDAKSAEAKSEAKSDGKSDAKSDRPDGKRSAQESGKSDKPVTRPDTKADSKDSRGDKRSDSAIAGAETKPDSDAKHASETKARFTLQLSSFQDKSEADAFLAATKSAGFQPYVVEADVTGKGTFYRVRLGSYRSLDAANDAKADYERTAKKTAQVTRL